MSESIDWCLMSLSPSRSALRVVACFACLMLAASLLLSGCAASGDAPESEPAQTSEQEAASSDDASKDAEDEVDPASGGDSAAAPEAQDESPVYVVSGVKVVENTGEELSSITYDLDERGATLKCASTSSMDDSSAVWDYTVNDDGLPETVTFTYTGEDGPESSTTSYEYEDVSGGLPATEITHMSYEEEGEAVSYDVTRSYTYEDGYLATAKSTTNLEGQEGQEVSFDYDAETGAVGTYKTPQRSVSFVTKKDDSGKVVDAEFTVDGKPFTAACEYDDNGCLTDIAFSPEGSDEGFSLQATYTKIDDPYPWVRANSRAFIWNGFLAELGL
ncbi:hypothetical protein [Xiamenia xianingshaonis]|uniref:hypothetical protein n=2 Tax=Xiamenia xianingshaonis TaxID=2682776 RepID=UPI0021BD1DBD|nr:hypothetical protein [Xiamenia xianingshaonis]